MAESKLPTYSSIYMLVNYNTNLVQQPPTQQPPTQQLLSLKVANLAYLENSKTEVRAYVLVGEYKDLTFEMRKKLIDYFKDHFYAKNFGTLTFAPCDFLRGYMVGGKSTEVSTTIYGELVRFIREFRYNQPNFEAFRDNTKPIELYTSNPNLTDFGVMFPKNDY